MTVIYSDFNDTDTLVLKRMWNGIKDLTLVRNGSKERIASALKNEKDTLLICGHGTAGGLWMPQRTDSDTAFPFRYAVSKKEIPLIRAERIIGIWCYASSFAEENSLRGFYSSMFISSLYEAALMGVTGVTEEEITRSELIFASRINALLKSNVPLPLWKDRLQKVSLRNDVERFNYSRLSYRS